MIVEYYSRRDKIQKDMKLKSHTKDELIKKRNKLIKQKNEMDESLFEDIEQGSHPLTDIEIKIELIENEMNNRV